MNQSKKNLAENGKKYFKIKKKKNYNLIIQSLEFIRLLDRVSYFDQLLGSVSSQIVFLLFY